MITKRIEDELNKQVNAEYWSAYFYLSMSAYCAEIGLAGAANWFRVQYQEEIAHALKFFDYIIERGGKVDLKPIAEVPKEWNGIIHIFEDTQKHEQIVTSLIYHLMDVAIEERDHAAKSFLQWYVDEQVEEEATAGDIVAKLKFAGNDGGALLMLDKELGTRVFVNPLTQATE